MRVSRLVQSILPLLLLVLASQSIFAQEKMISGSVLDKGSQEPLPGVTVIVQGTTRGSVTDFDGNFTLKVSEGEILNVSYIGYLTSNVTVGAESTYKIDLATDTQGLDEVIVVGYGTTKKEDLTGSVQAISSDDFKQGGASSPQELINGKVSGVQITSGGGAPGSGSTIRIRGGSSMSASNDPLIIVDGVPLDNNGVSGMRNPLNVVNPNDIETFTVLKDASATAIYGSRASNGVILITTKKGSKEGLHIDYSGKFSVATAVDQVDMLDADEYRTLYAQHHPDQLDLLGNSYTNWQDEIISSAFQQDHNISVSGTITDNLPFRASIGYNNADGILETSNLERLTGSLNLNPSFFDDHLRVNISLKGMNVKNRFADTGAIGTSISMDPTQSVREERVWKDTDGDGTPDTYGYDQYGGYYTWTDGSAEDKPIVIAPANPVALLEQKNNSSDVNRFIGNAQVDYRFHFLPDLRANLNVGYDYSKGDGSVVVDEQAAFDTGAFQNGGSNNYYGQEKKNELIDFYLQYATDLDKIDSRIDVMGGYSWQHFWWESTNRTEYGNGTVREANQLDRSENYLVSFFGRMNYTFKERYLLTATVRQDGSSKFSEDNRWGLFPSLALGWNMKKEGFLSNVDAVSQMKLRAGYGVTGQQDIGTDYGYYGVYTGSGPGANYSYVIYNPETGKHETILVDTNRPEGYDPNLKWEETTTYNVGIDYGFFNGRLSGSLEAYWRETQDMLNTVPVAAGSNLENMLTTNVGNMTNKGIEFSVTGNIINNNDWNWDVTANVSHNKNEITKLTATDDPNYEGVTAGYIAGGTGTAVQRQRVGSEVNSFYVYEQIYDENGRPIEGAYVDQNGDGQIDESDLRVYNSPAPKVTMGLSTSLSYKNWDFSASARANIGGYVYNNIASDNAYSSGLNVNGQFTTNIHSDYYNTGFVNPQYLSDYYVQKASFFRLDNVQVGYNFSNAFDTGARVRLYGSVDNVLVITNYDGLDPEVDGGIDSNVYPRPRTFLFGVNVSF